MEVAVQYPVILLFIPVTALILLAGARSLRVGSRVRKGFIIGIRFVLMCFILLAMSGISIHISSKDTGTVFLLDVSESFAANREEAIEMVRGALKELPKEDRAAVVVFGADARVEQFMSDVNLFTGVETMPVVTATNIENAVKSGMALFDDGEAKRMVLITDGRQNEGQLEKMSALLRAEHVEVNVLQKDIDVGNEAYVSGLIVPEKIQTGDRFRVQIEVESTVRTDAILQLYTGGRLSRQESVSLQKGSNSFIFQDVRKKKGFTEYRAVIIPDKDTVSINNEYSAYTEAGGAERILLVEGEKKESKEFQKLLSSANIAYDTVVADAAPENLEGMNRYQCIILEDTPADSLPSGFINSLDSYVKDYGGGFIALGGKKSFAPGGYKDTPIEDVLPVDMDISKEEKIPEMAMVMVIDKSSSMQSDDGGNSKLEMAKDAAALAVDNLRETDSIGVISFDDTYGWNVPVQKAEGKKDIKSRIYGIRDGGGTSIYPAVKEAFDKIKDLDCQLKHIILLTDGQDSYYSAYPGLIEKLEKYKITLSTVSIGTDADDAFLQKLAESSGGRFYNTRAGTELSRIFAKEVYLAQKEYIVNRVFTPVVKNTGTVLGDEIQDGLPAMGGYIATSIKPEALQVLSSDKDEEPVLACWQYGIGRTAAFTSDVTNQWTGNYAKWDGYPDFWKSIISWVTDTAQDEESTVSVAQEGSKGKIVYTTAEYSGSTEISATITGVNGKKTETKLKATSPGVYEGEIALTDTGIYSVNVKNIEDGLVKDSKNARLAMQYSQEYRFADATDCLDSFVEQSGGQYIENLEGIFDSHPEEASAYREITLPLLIAAVIFLLADIVYRKLDIRPGARIFSFVQNKINLTGYRKRAERIAPVQKNVKDKPEADDSRKTKEKVKRKKQEAAQELLDVGSLLKKQKERER